MCVSSMSLRSYHDTEVRFELTLPNHMALDGATTINEMLDLPEMADSSGMSRHLVR